MGWSSNMRLPGLMGDQRSASVGDPLFLVNPHVSCAGHRVGRIRVSGYFSFSGHAGRGSGHNISLFDSMQLHE